MSVAALLAACATDRRPSTPTTVRSAESEHTPASAPAFRLAATPSEKLGTAPAGFGLRVGDQAPDASLPDITGKELSLAALYQQGPTLVIFYRGGWCPFCNLQLHEFSGSQPDFERRGVHIVAISVDRPSEEAKTQAKQGVPFPMLSDSNLVAHRAYKVVHVPGDAERKALANYGIDLAAYSGEHHGSFAVPALFLVDRGGTIRFVHADEDYMTRPSAEQMLAVVDRVLGAR
ncbi:MAG TPA: peroxiredoxin-like family protein [Planctomycetota bacterium]|nr:peroxiredoxin-like family protein [Planctomycetota bacterium]